MRPAMLLMAVPALAAGCCLEPVRYPRFSNPENPFPVRKVAVCPLSVLSGDAPDPLAAGEALAAELSQFPGFEVIWPRAWLEGWKGPLDLQDLLNRARAAGADAVLLATLNESSAYPPPRMALAMALYPVRPLSGPVMPYEERMDAGRPFVDALPKAADPWLGAAGMVQDARDGAVQGRLHGWGLRRSQSEASFDWKRGLYSQEEFLRFCLNEALRKLCDEGRTKFPRKSLKAEPRDLYSPEVHKPFPDSR